MKTQIELTVFDDHDDDMPVHVTQLEVTHDFDDWDPCFDQDGCSWEGTSTVGYCTGTATRCSDDAFAFEWSCAYQDGCFWDENICQGDLYPCTEITDEDICNEVIGCEWG